VKTYASLNCKRFLVIVDGRKFSYSPSFRAILFPALTVFLAGTKKCLEIGQLFE
jgi:hypothetical protein